MTKVSQKHMTIRFVENYILGLASLFLIIFSKEGIERWGARDREYIYMCEYFNF